MRAHRLILLALLIGLPLAIFAFADDGPAKIDPAEEQAIRDTVDKYFRGVVNADRKLLEEAWHMQRTQMMYVKSLGVPEPQFEAVPIDVAIQWWTKVKAKSSSGKILSLDVVKNEMALVKFDFHYEHMHYIDYLTLLKLKEGWKIVNKSFVRIMPGKGEDVPEKAQSEDE